MESRYHFAFFWLTDHQFCSEWVHPQPKGMNHIWRHCPDFLWLELASDCSNHWGASKSLLRKDSGKDSAFWEKRQAGEDSTWLWPTHPLAFDCGRDAQSQSSCLTLMNWQLQRPISWGGQARWAELARVLMASLGCWTNPDLTPSGLLVW